MEQAAQLSPLSHFEQIRLGREVLRQEGSALLQIADGLSDSFCKAVELLFTCDGNVIVTGMGKAGLIGQKVTATLASTGTASHFLHPAEAIHGDLGRIHHKDLVLALSFSGETEEVVRLLPHLHSIDVPLVAITARETSSLARAATVTLALGSLAEACPLGLAPSTSTAAMLGLGDAVALVLSQMRRFGREDFARFHPGGSLGRKLASVDDVMRPLSECRVASRDMSLRDVLVHVGRPGRRTGAIMLTDTDGKLSGIFTDSDLARRLEKDEQDLLNTPVATLMTQSPRAVAAGSRLSEALTIFAEFKISELPVIGGDGKPLGLVDITDVVGLMPASTEPASPTAPQIAPHTIPIRTD